MNVGYRGLRSRQGFSLVEMMIAVGLTATVAMGSLALIQHLGRGVKGATDTADITSTLTSVSTLLSDATMCKSAISAVQKGKQSSVTVPEFMKSTDAGVLGAPYFNWESEVGQLQEISSDGIYNAGLIGIPTKDGGISQVLLASSDIAELYGLPHSIPGNGNVRVAQMGLVRMTPKEDVIAEGIAPNEVCRVQTQFRIVFEKVDRKISSGASRFERGYLLNARVSCPNGDQVGVEPVISCGMAAPDSAQACTELGGEYFPKEAPGQRCLFRAMRFANSTSDRTQPLELNPDPLQGTPVANGFTDALPGRMQLHGNSNTAFVLDTAISSNFDAGQVTFSRSYGSLSSRAVLPGVADLRAAQVPLGGISFRGLNQVSNTGYSSAPNNGREFTQAAGVTVTTDGAWALDSSPTRMNFSTTRLNNDTWWARGTFASAVSDRPELLRVYPDKVSGHGTIPGLSIRADQRVELAAELRFGIGTRIGDGTARGEPQPGQSYTGGAAANTTASGLRVTHRRGGSLGILSIPASSPAYGYRSKLALSSESDLITVLQLRNTESGENLDLEARDLLVRDVRGQDLYVNGNNPSDLVQRTPNANQSVLAAADDNGRARWLQPKQIKMAGSVNIDNGNTAASSSFRLNLSKCAQEGTPTGQLPVYTAGVSTVHPGDGQTGCHHLQYISGGAPSAAALAAINMTGNVSGSPSPTSGNRVDWDMCYISENFTEFNDSVQTGDRNGCRLDLTNDGWVLRGDAKGKLRIRCEAFCLKMVFE